MLVLTRQAGQSICIGSDDAVVVTVVSIDTSSESATLDIRKELADEPRVVQLAIAGRVEACDSVFITLIEVRGPKIRLGIESPPGVPIFRPEIHPDGGQGGDGTPARLPIGPNPSGLSVRMDIPKSTDDL
jgi:sRNA-binding carbon storage regulator CsrA